MGQASLDGLEAGELASVRSFNTKAYAFLQ